jgi:hypothetical protein
MLRTLFAMAVLCPLMLGLGRPALAQTTTTLPGSATAENQIASNMTASQYNVYLAMNVYSNFATQVATAAAYSNAEQKLQELDPLSGFDQYILSRGPEILTAGNQAYVPVNTSYIAPVYDPLASSGSSSSSTSTTQ